jgi:hypothetical protein
VVDRQFADASLAALYDLFCPFEPRGDFGFYLPLVMSAEAVLDVDGPQVSRSTLRFLDPVTLGAFLSGAGLAIEAQFGDWNGDPLTETSPEIITFATRG